MFSSLKKLAELFCDQLLYFRLLIVIILVCVHRLLLQYVIKFRHCPNPFCSRCLDSDTMRERIIKILENNGTNSYINNVDEIKESKKEVDQLYTLVLTNLVQHKRLLLKNIEQPTIYYHRGLSSTLYNHIEHKDVLKTYLDCKILLDQYDMILQEFIRVLQHDNGKWQNDSIQKRSLLYLYKNGVEHKTNCKLMPKTFELLQTLPNAIISNQDCLFGNCMITCLNSVVLPTNEQEHGITSCRIRCHLGLKCTIQDSDNKQVYILINKHKRLSLENRHMIAYNDSIMHQYVNNTNYKQYVLTVDLWHPDLSSSMRKHLTNIFHSRLSL
ncbi:unnamed protein product [Didymodactylos carnosus]|uniref:Aspartyl/asparaginy/proline hydroxylase domain-containing protein n=1 Tax=Didymodactylos carnosus TaxID=1234261 RepID=A0A8S2HZH8_9BILA|nr:unnamed protein product [Didymodactylos carnosus]CAF3700285.1 unnamed protein product [Didymodactylos carnosus]